MANFYSIQQYQQLNLSISPKELRDLADLMERKYPNMKWGSFATVKTYSGNGIDLNIMADQQYFHDKEKELKKNFDYNVIEVISESIGVDKDAISVDNMFVELGMDSLDSVEIVMKCENLFGIEIEETKFTENSKVIDLINYIKERI